MTTSENSEDNFVDFAHGTTRASALNIIANGLSREAGIAAMIGTKTLPDYQSLQVRSIPLPQAKDCGNGWWCVEWVITTDPVGCPQHLHMPSPPLDLGEMALVVTVLPREPNQIAVEVLTRHPRLEWNEIAYLSLVMQAIRALYRQISIDGYIDHPILHVSKP